MFEMAPLGIVVALAGLALSGAVRPTGCCRCASRWASLLSDRRKMKFFTEVAVPEDCALIGQTVDEVDLFKRDGVRVIDVLRGDASLRRDLAAGGAGRRATGWCCAPR